MPTQTPNRPSATKTSKIPTRADKRPDEFIVVASDQGLGLNAPQEMGNKLWAPMFVMGVMAFAAALILGFVRSNAIATAAGAGTIAQLGHVTTGVMFIGFTAVLSAITFAIARILGVFRSEGGNVQTLASGHVQTLTMPAAAKGMILSMVMGMMAIIVAVGLHVYVAASVVGASEASLATAAQWGSSLEGVRRLGVGMHLFGIVLGLATIVHVLRFQSIRILEVAKERTASR